MKMKYCKKHDNPYEEGEGCEYCYEEWKEKHHEEHERLLKSLIDTWKGYPKK